jgi:hypothetical protein
MPQVAFQLLRRFEAVDDSLLIRRYMPDRKFTSLLESRSLYFTPASKLSDKLEGNYTHLNGELSDRQLTAWKLDSQARAIAAAARALVPKHNQKAVVICCWTEGIGESPRMWSEYGGGSQAVALQTTVGRLRQALGDTFLIVPVST